jgi:hypothetical protein
VVAAVHARLGVKQIEEVVKVGDFTLGQRLVDAQRRSDSASPGKALHRANGKAPGLGQFDSLLVMLPVYHIASTAFSAASSHTGRRLCRLASWWSSDRQGAVLMVLRKTMADRHT